MKQNSAAGNTELEVSISLHSASREEAKAAEGLLLQAVGPAAPAKLTWPPSYKDVLLRPAAPALPCSGKAGD